MRSRYFTSQTLQDLENTNVFVQSTGKAVPLSQVARIVPQWDYAKIMHYDLSRSIIVTSELRQGSTAREVTEKIRTWLDNQSRDWPPGYRYELGGDAENTQENMAAVIRYLPLAGIVINNAIVLIDRIDIEQSELNRPPAQAVVEACRQRFRPILLTTLTTTLKLMPLYLGGGNMWQPMAVSIMAGLLFGTTITLLFIPALYSILYKVDATPALK